MALKIKICGLNTHDTVDAAIAAGVDMIGFNFHPRSPRYVTPAHAANLAANARGRVDTVALTVDMPPAERQALIAQVRPDWLQLHGSENEADVRVLAARGNPLVIKVVGVAAVADLAHVETFGALVPLVLLDAKPPKDAAYPGGHGKPFDWSILRPLAARILLAGGLNPDNVAEAIRAVRARGVDLAGIDVASGVESAPGVKDIAKIRAFIAAARAADAAAPGRS